jgi:hypothetical protein
MAELGSDASGLLANLAVFDLPLKRVDPAPHLDLLFATRRTTDPAARRRVYEWLEREGPDVPVARLGIRALLGKESEPDWTFVDRLWADRSSWRSAILHALLEFDVHGEGYRRQYDRFKSWKLEGHVLELIESALAGEAGPARKSACDLLLARDMEDVSCPCDSWSNLRAWFDREVHPLVEGDLLDQTRRGPLPDAFTRNRRSVEPTWERVGRTRYETDEPDCTPLEHALSGIDASEQAISGFGTHDDLSRQKLGRLARAKSKILDLIRRGAKEIGPPARGCCPE